MILTNIVDCNAGVYEVITMAKLRMAHASTHGARMAHAWRTHGARKHTWRTQAAWAKMLSNWSHPDTSQKGSVAFYLYTWLFIWKSGDI